MHLESCEETPENWKLPESEPDTLEPDETITPKFLTAWNAIIEQIRMVMPKASFDTWVRDAKPIHLTETNNLTVAVRNTYARDWLTSRLKSTFEHYLGHPVEFVVPK